MLSLRRPARLPGPLAARLGPGDRPLAVAELTDGKWAVVTKGALVLLDDEGLRQHHPWHEIEQGSWDGDSRQLTITWVEGTREPLVLTTMDDQVERFTGAARERVQSSVVHVESQELPGGALVRVNVRRGADGGLFSQVTAIGDLRGDADERRMIDDLERRARAAVGLTT